MNSNELKKVKLKIHGTHCASCEVLIERKFKKIDGVEKVRVNFVSGKAELYCSKDPSMQDLKTAIKDDGYTISPWQLDNTGPALHTRNARKDYLQIGGIFLVVVALYYILKNLNWLPSFSISQHMSYGFVFLIGLVAAVSTCIAVVGGLLLAMAAKYDEQHPDVTGIKRFKPHLYFNAGRIVGYTAFGAAVGAFGSVLTLSPNTNGYLIVLVSFVMLLLGLQLLHLFPGLQHFSPKMPKFIANKIHDLSTKESKGVPFALGAFTFFLPCGFTQALQLYVLASGNWKVGALTMLAFSLGTLPALLSLSAISSFAKGAFQRYFLKFAGVVVVMLAVYNINNGLTLAGFNNTFTSLSTSSNSEIVQAAKAPIVDGKQIIKMTVSGYTYTPSQFTVEAGVPVEWQIENKGATGCGQVLVSQKLKVAKYLTPDAVTTINFTPTEPGDIPFNCTMGMMTRGAKFTVIANTSSQSSQSQTPGIVKAAANLSQTRCNPQTSNCIAQQFDMEFSYERQGFWPKVFSAKVSRPVELYVNVKDDPGGCMGTMVVPKYNVAQTLALGESNVVKFTPTETGTVKLVCSMGGPIGEFTIIN